MRGLTTEMLHDPTTHDVVRRLEFMAVLAAVIMALHVVLYHVMS